MPIVVVTAGGTYVVVDGHQRVRCLRRLQRDTVMAVVWEMAEAEALIFRHLLRLILLCGEFLQVCPKDTTLDEWNADLRDISERLTSSCRAVDPESTDKAIEAAETSVDFVKGEATAIAVN